jgi:hypothetical protein
MMEYNLEKLASRVDDIENTIGDIAQVLEALKGVLDKVAPPTCPPYCDSSKAEFANYKDDLSLQDRVTDIRRHIGDTGRVFAVLHEALEKMAPPNCPPYCCHELPSWEGKKL